MLEEILNNNEEGTWTKTMKEELCEINIPYITEETTREQKRLVKKKIERKCAIKLDRKAKQVEVQTPVDEKPDFICKR